MEQDPPIAKEVGQAALDDLVSNFDLAKKITFPVIPIMIVLGFADTIAVRYLSDDLGGPSSGYFLFLIFYTLLTAWVAVHYVMRWHRFTLLGDVNCSGQWLQPDAKYKHFFYKTLVIQAVVFITIFLSVFLLLAVPILGLLLFIPIFFIGVYSACRLSFILPATVLGHTPNIKEIWDFAKGMVGKTIWAPIRATYKYIIALFVYLFIIGIIVGSMTAGEPLSLMQDMMVFLLATLPTLLASILFGLVYVGVLSRYYQWGLENRTDAYGDFK